MQLYFALSRVAFLVILATASFQTRSAYASLQPDNFGMISDDCVKKATVICAGRIVATRDLPGTKSWWGHYINAPGLTPREADFNVDDVIRGPSDLVNSTIRVRYIGFEKTNNGMNSMPDFPSIVGKKRCLVCLIKTDPEGKQFGFSSDNGSFAIMGPAPANQTTARSEEEKLTAEIVSTLSSGDSSLVTLTLQYLRALHLVDSEIKPVLKNAIATDNMEVAYLAASNLIASGDLDELYQVSDQLDAWKGNSYSYVGGALAGLKDQKLADAMAPALVHLLLRPEEKVRLGASYAFRKLACEESVAALMATLADPDESIRYNAAFALAFQTNRMNKDWAWGFDHFRSDPSTLIDKWKKWWEQEGKSKYPSLESVLKEYDERRAQLEKEGKLIKPRAMPREAVSKPHVPPTVSPR